MDTAQVTDRAPTPTFPSGPASYSGYDESNFRRQVERAFQDVITYAGRLTRQGGDLVFDGDQLDLLYIETAAYKSLQDMRDVAQSAGWISGGTISGEAAPTKLAEDTFTDSDGEFNGHVADSGFGTWGGIGGVADIVSNTYEYQWGTNLGNVAGNEVTPTSDADGLTVVFEVALNASATNTYVEVHPQSNGGIGYIYNNAGGVRIVVRQQTTSDLGKISISTPIGGSTGRSPAESTGALDSFAWTWGTTKRIIGWVREVSGTLYLDLSIEDTDGSNHVDFGTFSWSGDYPQEYYWGAGFRTPVMGGQTFSSLYHRIDNLIIYDGEYTGGTAGVDVTAGEGSLRSSASDVANLYFIEWAASTANTAPTDGNTKYVGVEYNSGAPQAVLSDTYSWDFQTSFPLGQVYNNSGSLEITQREVSRHFPKGVNVGTWLDVGTTLDVTGATTLASTLDVTGAATFGTAGVTIGTAVGGGDLTVEGNVWLPTIGIIAMGVGTAYGQISLDTGAGIGITSPESVTVDIDANNDGTTAVFKVRSNLSTDAFTVSEAGAGVFASYVQVGGNLLLGANAITGAFNSMYVETQESSNWNVVFNSSDNIRAIIDGEADTSATATFGVYEGITATPVFSVREDGLTAVLPGTTVTYAGGIDLSDTAHFFVGGTVDASSGTPVGSYFYTEVSTGGSGFPYSLYSVVSYTAAEAHTTAYGTAVQWEHNGTGNVTTVEILNVGGGTGSSTGNVTTMRALKIGNKYEIGGTIGTYYGIYVSDLAATDYIIKTQGGIAHFENDAFIIGTDTSGANGELLRVGGTVRFEDWDLTHASGYDEGFVVAGTHSVASTGGPVGAGFYLGLEHTTGNVAEFYGVDIGAYVAATGNTVTWGTALELWAGTDGGAITTLDVLYITSPWGTITNACGLKIADITAGSSTNRAIETGEGEVRFGGNTVVVDPGGAIGDESYISFTGGRAHFGYYGTNSAARMYAGSGKNAEFWVDNARSWYMTSTAFKPNAGNTLNIGDSTYYVNDIYLQRVRANSYLYVYPYASGTGGGLLYLDGYAGTPTVYCRASTGTYSSKAAIGAYSSLGVWAGQGWDGTNWFTGASIQLATAANAWSGTDHGSNIYFATIADASTTLTTRWRIHSGGSFMPYADDTYDLGHTSYRVQAIHATGLKATGSYTIVNPTGGTEVLPTNMTAGLVVRRDSGTLPTVNSANVAVFSSNSAAGTNAIVNIIAGTTGTGQLLFGDSGAYHRGGISYDHSETELKLSAGSTYYVALKSGGNLLLRDDALAELATTATAGFVHIPTMNGAPSGTPTTYTGTLPIVYDRSNNHLMVYNGAWETIHTTIDGYDEMTTPVGTTSATLEDVTGSSVTITLPTAKDVTVHASFELETQSGASPSVIAVALSGDGTDSNEHQRYLSGTSDLGIGAIVAQFSGVAAGSRTFKLRFRRVSGTATPGINIAHLYVHAH